MPHGVDDLDWDVLLLSTIEALIEVGARRKLIAYGELSGELRNRPPKLKLDPQYGAMPHLLEAVNVEALRIDRGAPMLSALVVNAATGEPGGGFYKAAENLGYRVPDRLMFWAVHVQRSHTWCRARLR